MELKIIEKKDNALLSRTELTLEGVKDGATPSYDFLRKQIASQFKAAEKFVAIKHVYPQFGVTRFKVIVYIYSDEKAMEEIEPAEEEEEKKEEEKKEEAKPEKKGERPEKKGEK